MFAEGHLLIEGVPGLGKTQLVNTLAAVAGVHSNRIQFTPDLMPADIVGTQVLVTDESGGRSFRFAEGPVFTSLLLADEINRATPKTQSALLEAMQERQVTAGGQTRALPRPFLVLATQNPIEQEGTYPLPEAQLDRFLLKSLVGMPSAEELTEIVDRTTGSSTAQLQVVTDSAQIAAMIALTRSVPVPSHVTRYAVDLVLGTHPGPSSPEMVQRYVRFGSSPRGAQALLLAAKVTALLDGRPSVSAEDVRAVAFGALRHRVGLGYEAAVDSVSAESVVENLLSSVKPGSSDSAGSPKG
ncbi:MAG: AAA family ATPase, partial [Microthrixaceae bacterium]|nr:AAA family ATPase [Microthrixaceae bacterium]